MNSSQIGIVPLNWKYDSARMGDYLSGIAGYGFKGIQISMDQGNSADFVRSMKDHSLNFAEIYVAVHMTPDGIEEISETETAETIALAARVGVEMVVFAVDGTTDRDLCATRAATGPQLTDAAFSQLAKHINRFAKIAKDHGMKSSFHPHAATFIETFSETEKLMNLLDPGLVGVCLDVGHWIVGGGDPIEAIQHFGERITHVHIKDVSGEVLAKLASGHIASMEDSVMKDKLFVPAGTGILDLHGVMRALGALNFTGWLMSEQDSAWEPAEAASGISYSNILAGLK
jgi:inosose dehydratase